MSLVAIRLNLLHFKLEYTIHILNTGQKNLSQVEEVVFRHLFLSLYAENRQSENIWRFIFYHSLYSKYVFFFLQACFHVEVNVNVLFKLIGEGNGNPVQYSCLEKPMDGGAWWAAVHGVEKSQRWLSDFTFTFHFHALEKEMATHSRVLAWRIPGTGEPGGLPSMGLHRVGHDWSDLATAAAVKCEF